jgi:thioredoxin-related protein
MKKILIINLLFLSLLFAKDLKYLPFNSALEIAKKDKKIIMLKLTAQNCHFCKKMDREVMVDSEVINALDKDFVSVSLDVNRDKLPLGLKKGMTPTFAFVNSSGELFSVIQGAWHKEDFLDLLKYIKKKSKLKRELKK